jgi:hypothetical protein
MTKLLIDRQLPSSESIANRRNFNEILDGLPKKKTINSPWFYGAIGFSTVFLFIVLNFFI